MATNRYQVESGFLIALSEAARMAAYNRSPAFVYQESISQIWEYTDRRPVSGFYLEIGMRGTVDGPEDAEEIELSSSLTPSLSDPCPWDGS